MSEERVLKTEKDSKKDTEQLLNEMDIEDKMMAGFLFYLADKRLKRNDDLKGETALPKD